MPLAVSVLLSLLLVAIGVAAFRRSGIHRLTDLLFGATLFVSLLLYLAYGIADHFTGEGLNESAWYHIRFGLAGAGLAAYRGVIAVAGAAVLIALLGAFGLPLARRRIRDCHPVRRVVAFGFVLASFLPNPALGDLYAVLHRGPGGTSDFRTHYRRPRLERTDAPTRNLVFIYAEGLERTFFDEGLFPGLITGLRKLEAQSTSFTDIRQVYGTGHTIAGIVASQCGLPLAAPFQGNRMGRVDQYLPGAIGLGDLLHREGYFLSFMGGAHLDFAGKGIFFRTHKFDEVLGRAELLPRIEDPTYLNAWGLYDDTLLDLAYERFVELAQTTERFGLFLLTLETHQPEGHISQTNAGVTYGDGRNPMLNAVASADRLITRFVERIRASPHGANTVVVVASDHLALPNTASDRLKRAERRNLFMVLEPPQLAPTPRVVNRRGSTLDIGATVLPFIGFRSDIGLGRDLLRADLDEKEVVRIQDRENLMAWRDDIDRFWNFPTIEHRMRVDVPRRCLEIDGRIYGIPALIRLRPDGSTSLSFPFSADGSDGVLIDEIRHGDASVPFILVDRCANAAVLDPQLPEYGWCVLFGRGSTVQQTEVVDRMRSWSRAEVNGRLGLED